MVFECRFARLVMTEALCNSRLLSVIAYNVVWGFRYNLRGIKCFGLVKRLIRTSHKISSWERNIDSTKKEKYLRKTLPRICLSERSLENLTWQAQNHQENHDSARTRTKESLMSVLVYLPVLLPSLIEDYHKLSAVRKTLSDSFQYYMRNKFSFLTSPIL